MECIVRVVLARQPVVREPAHGRREQLTATKKSTANDNDNDGNDNGNDNINRRIASCLPFNLNVVVIVRSAYGTVT